MKNIVLAFDGQGSQKIGLGIELSNAYPIVKKTFEEASEILNRDVGSISLDEEFIHNTELAQVYIITLDIALFRLIKSYGIVPDYTCGFSLGEYASLVCADVISFEDVLRIVSMRGRLMNQNTKDMWNMLSIIGLKQEEVENIISKFPCTYLTNINTELNNVIVTKTNNKDRVIEALKEYGAKKINELKANVPFHTIELKGMCKEYEEYLKHFVFRNPMIPVFKNIDSNFYISKDDVIKSLVMHNIMPVQFKTILKKIAALKDVTWIEVGYSDMLCKMAKNTNKKIELYNTSSKENIDLMRNKIIGENMYEK